MNTLNLTKNVQKLVTQRNIFLFFSVLLSGAVLLLSISLLFKKERIVILPTTGPAFWIEDNQTSETYLEKMGYFLAEMLLTRQPFDIDKKNRIILENTHPAFYHEAKRQLYQDTQNILKNDQSFFFRVERSYTQSQTASFIVEGESLLFIGKAGETPVCADRERVKYTFGFHCENGKLLFRSLKKEALSYEKH